MSKLHDGFEDAETALFLNEEAKDVTASEQPCNCRCGHRRAAAYYWPHILLSFGGFLALAIFVYLAGTRKAHLLLSQSLFSKVPQKLVTFQLDVKYNVDPFQLTDNPWTNLLPPGKGHVQVKNPSALGLSGGFPYGEQHEVYTISMFHQLHCLAALKSEMWLLRDWVSNVSDRNTIMSVLQQDRLSEAHLYHCFDYLRQAIMCSGDTTLEKVVDFSGLKLPMTDGWGSQHECRDYDAIYAFAAEHRITNSTELD